MNCINKNDPKVIEFAEILKQRPEVIAAAFGVWQNQNNNFTDFPDLDTTKQLLTKPVKQTTQEIPSTKKFNLTQIEQPINKEIKPNEGFQGYKGGFENTGKGTPQGDGKDKAMREIADGFIGEIGSIWLDENKQNVGLNFRSSSYTSLKVINERRGGQTFKQDGVLTTYDANPKVIMLARNSEFKGEPLDDRTKAVILDTKNRGAEFVVGDMPNVDSQFIDYLQEIGAKFTIYHTGKESRIKIQNQSTEIKPQIEEQVQLVKPIEFKRQSRPDQIIVNDQILNEVEVGYLLDGMTFYYTNELFGDAEMVEKFVTPNEKGERTVPEVSLEDIRANMNTNMGVKLNKLTDDIVLLEEKLKKANPNEKSAIKAGISALTTKVDHLQFVIKHVLGYDSDADGLFTVDLGQTANFRTLYERFEKKLDLIGLKAAKESQEDYEEHSSAGIVNVPSMYLDPKKSASATIRLLLSSINQMNEQGDAVYNDFGLTQMLNPGTAFNILGWHLTENLPQGRYDIQYEKVKALTEKYPEYEALLDKLGETTNMASIPAEMLRTQFVEAFSLAKPRFLTGLIDKGVFKLNDSNTETNATRIKKTWIANYWANTADKEVWEVTKARIKKNMAKLNNKKEGVDKPLARAILYDLGLLEVSDETLESTEFEKGIVNELNEIVTRGLVNSNMFWEKGKTPETKKNEILGRLDNIIQEEAKNTKSATDLQFLDEKGKPVYGLTLNTFLTNFGQELNSSVNNGTLESLFEWVLKDPFNYGGILSEHVRSGKTIEFGILKSLYSKDGKTHTGLAQGDIGDLISADMIAAFEGKNLPPTTGDREVKSYWSIGKPLVSFGSYQSETATYLLNHLKAELLASTDSRADGILYLRDKERKSKLRLLADVFKSDLIDAQLAKKDLTDKQVDKFIEDNHNTLYQTALNYLKKYTNDVETELKKLGFDETMDVYTNEIDPKTQKNIKIKVPIDTPTSLNIKGKLQNITFKEASEYYAHLRLVALIESQKFFLGDPAGFKNPDDALKRYSLYTATKQVPRTDPAFIRWINAKFGYNLDSKNPIIPVWVVNDPIHKTAKDTAIQAMYELQEAVIRTDVESSSLSKENKEKLIEVKMKSLKKAYTDFKSADSQGWINSKTARLIKLIHGQWTNLDDTIYNKYLTPFSSDNKTYLPEEYYPRISPIKTQYVGPMADYKDKYVQTNLKHALLHTTKELVHDKRFSELLKVVDDYFDGVAIVQTLSGVKMGTKVNSQGKVDELFDEETGMVNQNPESFHYIYLKYFGEQQALDPKNKVEGTVGGQQRRFGGFQDLFNQGKALNPELEELSNQYEKTQIELFEQQWSNFLKESGITGKTITKEDIDGNKIKVTEYYYENTPQSRGKLVSNLLDVVSKRQVSNNVIEAIEQFINAEMLLDAVPGKRKLESLFLAPVREALSKEYRNGGMRVLASYTGMEKTKDDEGLAWYNYDKETKTVTPAEVILPPAYKQKVNIGDLILIFRIPSTGVASIDIVKVKDFAPVGDVIFHSPHLLPKTNADHDVDKVIIFLPNYDEKGNYVHSGGKSKKALENRMLELATKLILHPDRFKTLTTPVGDGVISETGKELGLVPDENSKTKTQIHDLKNPIVNHQKAIQFHGGKNLVSHLSIYTTQSPLKQKVNLYWNIPVERFHVFFDYKTVEIDGVKYPSMGNLLDSSGNRISELFTEMTQHSLDVQNNPTISQIGVDYLTLPNWATITDIGGPQEGIIRLINHPIVQKYIAFKKKNNRAARDRGQDNYQDNLKSGTEDLLRDFFNRHKLNLRYENLISTLEYELQKTLSFDRENTEKIEKLNSQIDARDKDLRAFRQTHTFEDGKGTLITDTFAERVLEEYLELERLGKWFNRLSTVSRPDADAVGSTSIEGFKETINARNAVINSGMFGNIDKFFKETFLRPSYEHSHAMYGAYDHFIVALNNEPISTDGTKTIAERMREIKTQLKGFRSKEEAIRFSNTIDDELLVAILMESPVLSYANNKDLIIENDNRPTVGQELIKYQAPNSPIRDNPFIKLLVPVTKNNISNIILAQRTMDAVTQNKVTNGFEELLSSSDENIRKFAGDYIKFAILQGGFSPGYFNLINTIPTLTMTNFVLPLYHNFINRANKKSFFDKFTKQLIQQDPLNMTIPAKKKTKKGTVEMPNNNFPLIWQRDQKGKITLLESKGIRGETGWIYEKTETTPQANQNPIEIKTYWAPELVEIQLKSGKNISDQEAKDQCIK